MEELPRKKMEKIRVWCGGGESGEIEGSGTTCARSITCR